MTEVELATGTLAVVRAVHQEHGDDLCWMDIDRVFAAAGLPVPDRRVGDRAAMLQNCSRYIDTVCRGGHWRTYRELEQALADAHELIAYLNRQIIALNRELLEAGVRGDES